ANGMLFGPLGSCPICSGSLRYSGAEYLFLLYYCTHTSKGEWRIPRETCNAYLCKFCKPLFRWFKSQKGCRSVRILPTDFSNQASGSQSAFKGLKVALIGVSEDSMREWKNKIHVSGGELHAKLRQGTNCLVVAAELDCEGHDQLEYNDHFQIIRARNLKLPVLRLDYLIDCTKRQKKLPFDQYLIESSYKYSRGSVTVKVSGNYVVHETYGMQGYSHILEDAKYIYSTTLNKSDLSIGVNRYCKSFEKKRGQIVIYFMNGGRVGNEQIGGNKLDEMSKAGAIREFKRLFLEKTGNHWEALEKKEIFQKQPGRYFPLDIIIDYGVPEQGLKFKESHLTNSRLAQPVQNLMKMLFNVETYREMPLGKLSKSNIQMGFSALTDLQKLLTSNNQDLSVRESLLIDASNRFFSIIPSTHPRVIRDENDLRSKVEMLEALQDIETASRIVGFNAEIDESLGEKYERLHCNILLLPHDSDDYQLVEKYLLNTHASTNKEWTLELEDVFALGLDREGEFDKFAHYREKLQNKMLLWHGSHLTKYVGILSNGLRIAPPEVPSSGYMFGKGIYFADLVSKSAQYCRTSNWNPVGLLLLSEVALGDVYELKEALDMEKPPEGKNSTKGSGKRGATEYVTWKNNVVVPCGKPVVSNARTSELMYNEYIFLVKVRFHHKRLRKIKTPNKKKWLFNCASSLG
ncbi:hypothetical protein MKX01_041404, partial [Papaver californicum]